MPLGEDQAKDVVNVLAILGNGHLEYEALLFAESFLRTQKTGKFKLHFAQPVKNPQWPDPPRSTLREVFLSKGITLIDFECHHFGERYPHGNKIEALFHLPAKAPFVFFDTDTLLRAPLPEGHMPWAASLRRQDTWPNLTITDHSRHAIWQAVYDAAQIDFDAAQNKSHAVNDFERYPYFNAGVVMGPCPHRLADIWLETALAVEASQHPALISQPKRPWLDQIALGPTIAALGGLSDEGLKIAHHIDQKASWHYRRLILALAMAEGAALDHMKICAQSADIKPYLENHEAPRRFLLSPEGERLRAKLYPELHSSEEVFVRQALKSKGLWIR